MTESTSEQLKEPSNYSSVHDKVIASLNLKFLEGHTRYSKFIILGKGRSGSTFLRGLLNSHSHVITFGEIFRKPDSIGWDLPPYDDDFQQQKLISLINRDPAKFIKKEVFRKYQKSISAVGFKVFYYHAQDASRKRVWSFLRKSRNFKILHIKRKNTLRELLSLRKAFQTNQWANTTGEKEKRLSIQLSYEDCLHEFTYARECKDKFDTFFQDHPKIDIVYENLESNYESEMRRIQDFLKVTYEPVSPLTYKQSSQALPEAISNYHDLKQQFAGTEWDAFFEE